ncbi:MAG: hypothetical protein KKE05_01090 [Nanoarchaeota archaeon]|nr:hypothetical protein [Nanoarchaeota archaeon]MBU1028569.1 hypothetical protein [Nanoarchaeota archaeon]
MFDGAFGALERVFEAGVNILGLEAITIMCAFGAVVGIVLGITAVKKAREIGN